MFIALPKQIDAPVRREESPENVLTLHRFISIVHGNKGNGVSTSIIYSITVLSPNVQGIPSGCISGRIKSIYHHRNTLGA